MWLIADIVSQTLPLARAPTAKRQIDSYETPVAESLLLLGRKRHSESGQIRRRLLITEAATAAVFIAAAGSLAALGSPARSFSLSALAVTVVAYLVAGRVRYPVGSAWTAPTQLVFVPMLFVLPTPFVPLIVAVCSLADQLPRAVHGRLAATRVLARIGDSSYSLGPALVLVLFDGQDLSWERWPLLLLAFLAQIAFDAGAGLGRTWFAERLPPSRQLPMLWLYLIDACLSCIGLLIAASAVKQPELVLLAAPLVGLLWLLARERQQRLQLAVSSKYTSEFFSNMSHELRTPLNSLLILASQLKDNPEHNLTEQQVQYASVIHSAGTDLLRLLNDILDLAKVESGTVTLEIGELRLDELQDALERDFGPVADQKGVAFSVELESGLPPTIVTDPGRLRQVLNNLLSNAFKFTEQGEVSVRMSRADSGWRPENDKLGRSGAVIAFGIADTGIGITAETQRRIFEAFAQADGTTARQYGGTGLGLSISRELVRLFGGEIALTSTPDQGSTFTVYLSSAPDGHAGAAAPPASEAPDSQPPPPPQHSPDPRLTGMKALIVDDDFRNIFALTTLLENGHVDVVSAESGPEGIAILERMPDIDIVLIDIMMPVMDGHATIRAMRNLPAGRDLPILAVTANVTPGERQRCIDAGASDYISKPIETDKLMRVLGQWLSAAAPAGPSPTGLR